MTLALRQAQLFECAVCKRHVDDTAEEPAPRRAFGAWGWHNCPACGREAPDFKTRALHAYIRRAERWVAKQRAAQGDEELARLWATAESWHQEWKVRVMERDRLEEGIRRARARWRQAIDEFKAARRSRREAAP